MKMTGNFWLQDGTIKIWDTLLSQCHITLSGHLQCVTCIKWGGTNLVYSSSQDRTIKVWRAEDVSPSFKINIRMTCFSFYTRILLFQPYIKHCWLSIFFNFAKLPVIKFQFWGLIHECVNNMFLEFNQQTIPWKLVFIQ